MRILIVEDETLAADQLKETIVATGVTVTKIDITNSVKETVDWLSVNNADLIFLDIQLGDGSSFDIFEQVKIKTPVIFTTAYNQYAIKAFKLNSIDYLLKPVKKEELKAAIDKYLRLVSSTFPDIKSLVETFKQEKKEYKKRFLIQVGATIQTVESNEIAFIYAMEKSVFLTTFLKRTLTIDYTLDRLQYLLNPQNFFRINRKLIINIKAINKMQSMSRSRILIELDPPAPKNIEALVSVERANEFKSWLDR
ncbi:MAG: response regulator transcription factor [Calditrichae bacterium]|nr:response regulator transcription factor [Calditrichota bacterium]MCB9057065.1 response regulator transcription factor [Calditrichia bacterium]